MSIHAKVSGTWQPITAVYRKIAGSWQAISQVHDKVSGTWQQVYSALSASLSTSYVSGSTGAPGTATSSAVLCTPSGGSSPYSYLWEYVSGDTGITIGSSTSAATVFQFYNPNNYFASKYALYRCRVTDSTSNVAYTSNVEVYLESSP